VLVGGVRVMSQDWAEGKPEYGYLTSPYNNWGGKGMLKETADYLEQEEWKKRLARQKKESSLVMVNLSIDPGIMGTGVAVWNAFSHKWDQPVSPLACWNILPSKGEREWLEKAACISSQIGGYIHNLQREGRTIACLYCEFPEFQDSVTGNASVRKGDLFKLCFLIGAIAEICWNNDIAFEPVKVSEWKGQLPKKTVIKRIKEIIPGVIELGPVSHSWDAIGLGLYKKGCF
jgi:hypothetical protein